MGGLSYRPALCTVLTGTMCFHAWPAVWRHGTGGLALEGGREGQKEGSFRYCCICFGRKGRRVGLCGGYSGVGFLVLFIAMQTCGFKLRYITCAKCLCHHTVVCMRVCDRRSVCWMGVEHGVSQL